MAQCREFSGLADVFAFANNGSVWFTIRAFSASEFGVGAMALAVGIDVWTLGLLTWPPFDRDGYLRMKERDPNRLWLEHGDHYLVRQDGQYWVTSDDGNLSVLRGPEILLQTEILDLGPRTDEGVLVKAAAVPWFEIFRQVMKNRDFLFQFTASSRKFEEFIAGAYRQAGWDEVTLTPKSADRGRDVIAVKTGLCSIRILDQVKAYAPHHQVTHNDVRAMLGVLSRDLNASKGIVTTTSDFAPTVLSGDEFTPLIPYRLELKNGTQLLAWLAAIQAESAR